MKGLEVSASYDEALPDAQKEARNHRPLTGLDDGQSATCPAIFRKEG